MNVLLATDGSQEATTAMTTAAKLVRHDDNEFHVLCVAPRYVFPVGKQKMTKETQKKLRESYQHKIAVETKRILKNAQDSLKIEGIKAKVMTEVGSPAATIVRVSEDFDLTVVGAAGLNKPTTLGLGPVASRVLENIRGSLLVSRVMVSERTPRILVAYDGSDASDRALQTLLSLFNSGSVEITLMNVVETPWVHLGLDRGWFDFPGDERDRPDESLQFEQTLRLEAENLIEQARKQLEPFSAAVNVVIEEGNPATEILGEAEVGEYDLIVIGATGERDYKHEMVGSVSAKVAWYAPCSVLVVK